MDEEKLKTTVSTGHEVEYHVIGTVIDILLVDGVPFNDWWSFPMLDLWQDIVDELSKKHGLL